MFNGFTGSRGGNPLLWPRLFWFARLPPAVGPPAPGPGRGVRHRPRLRPPPAVQPPPGGGRHRRHRRPVLRRLGQRGGQPAPGPAPVRPRRPARPAPGGLPDPELAGHRGHGRPPGQARSRSGSGRCRCSTCRGTVGLLLLGLAGELVAGLDAGGRSHRNYWGVATQHSLFFGAATVGAVAALYFWAPKLWGRHLSEKLGTLQFLALVGGLLPHRPAHVRPRHPGHGRPHVQLRHRRRLGPGQPGRRPSAAPSWSSACSS